MGPSRWSRVPDAILVACAVVVAALVVRRELFTRSSGPQFEPRQIENWEEVARVGHVKGDPQTAVRLVEFSDFQCPFCAELQPRLRRLQGQYPTQVAIIYRHFPLRTPHPHAYAAALASECAAAQGKFQEYHDALYAEQDLIGTVEWEAFGRKAGLPDLREFTQCVLEKRLASRVDADLAVARSLDLLGTPTVIVNGTELVGAILGQLERRVTAAVEKAQRAPGARP